MTDLQQQAANLSQCPDVEQLLRLALREDIGHGDVTTQATVPEGAKARAEVIARQGGVVCGFPILNRLIELSAFNLTVDVHVAEGEEVQSGKILADMHGDAGAILTLERTFLNFLQRLSGIATMTKRYVNAVTGTKAHVLETRKTIPGWRSLDKYAVLAGGGSNHRQGLFDQILAKENHFALVPQETFAEKLGHLKGKATPGIKIEVEVEDLAEAQAAMDANIELILLDNMTQEDMKKAVEMREATSGCTSLLEASGGITLENMSEVAATGVDRISIGALTHSVQAFDLSLLITF